MNIQFFTTTLFLTLLFQANAKTEICNLQKSNYSNFYTVNVEQVLCLAKSDKDISIFYVYSVGCGMWSENRLSEAVKLSEKLDADFYLLAVSRERDIFATDRIAHLVDSVHKGSFKAVIISDALYSERALRRLTRPRVIANEGGTTTREKNRNFLAEITPPRFGNIDATHIFIVVNNQGEVLLVTNRKGIATDEDELKAHEKVIRAVEAERRGETDMLQFAHAESGLKYFPAQASLWFPRGTHGNRSKNYSYNLSLNLISGEVGRVNGVEISGLAGRVDNSLNGIQIAGLGNLTETVNGIQIGGLGNFTYNMNGIQVGTLLNFTDQANGIQIGGLVNLANGVNGTQISAINAGANVNGILIGALGNYSAYVNGAQIGGLANYAYELNGVQIGTFNSTNTLRGLQIGLVSINDTIEKGGSLSLVNIVRRGFYRSWEISTADYSNLALTYRMGTRTLYTIYTVGANFVEDNLWNFGFGFGHRRAISNSIDFRPELVSYSYFPMDFRNTQPTFSTHLKFGFVYNINKNFGLSLAPSVFVLNSRRNSDTAHHQVSPISPFFINENGNRKTAMGFGISLGLNWR